MTGKPQIAFPEGDDLVQFGDLLRTLPRQVADVLLVERDPLLADMERPRVIRQWRAAVRRAAENGELRGSMLSAGALSGWMMWEGVTVDSIRSFLELRGFEVVSVRPDVPGELQTRVIQTRKDDLSSVIAQAQERAADSTDTAGVWRALMQMAETKVPPLFGFADGEVKYNASDGNVGGLSKRALTARLDRARKKKGR